MQGGPQIPVVSILGVVTVALGLGGAPACAADAARLIHFDIPTQSLPMALRAFASATRAYGVYDGKLVADHMSVALKGDFRPEAALAMILDGTGLVAEYTSKDAFVVVAPPNGAVTRRPVDISSAALSSLSDLEQRYSALLQQSLEMALCSVSLTRPGDYRAAISLTLDARGVVQQLRLLSSTGDARRDAAIVAVGTQASVGEPPPPGMRQPLAMVILPRQSGAVLQCTTAIGRG